MAALAVSTNGCCAPWPDVLRCCANGSGPDATAGGKKKPLLGAALCFALIGLVRRGTRGDRETPARPGENCRAAEPQKSGVAPCSNVALAGSARRGTRGDRETPIRPSEIVWQQTCLYLSIYIMQNLCQK